MKEDHIIRLLARFMDGETTVSEETQLARYFRDHPNAPTPKGMAQEDWDAYREMFRQFDQGFTNEPHSASTEARPKVRSHTLWHHLTTAAAAAAAIYFAYIAYTDRSGTMPSIQTSVTQIPITQSGHSTQSQDTIIEAATTIKTVPIEATPVDTTTKTNKAKTVSPDAKPKLRSRPLYTQPIPRHLLANTTTTREPMSEDSIAAILDEVERLVSAMTVYQEIRINELCNTESEILY